MGAEHESLSKEILVTVTGIIHIGPAIFHGVILAGDGEAVDCQVYDGVNANGEERFHIEAVQSTTFGWRSTDGVLFHKGIYVAVSGSGAHTMIEYHPIRLGAKGKIIRDV